MGMKEFLEEYERDRMGAEERKYNESSEYYKGYWEGSIQGKSSLLYDFFVFLWGRGGKQFVDFYYTLKKLSHNEKPRMDFRQLKNLALERIDETEHEKDADAQDFLDCVAIDEDRVKELIKELKKK